MKVIVEGMSRMEALSDSRQHFSWNTQNKLVNFYSQWRIKISNDTWIDSYVSWNIIVIFMKLKCDFVVWKLHE